VRRVGGVGGVLWAWGCFIRLGGCVFWGGGGGGGFLSCGLMVGGCGGGGVKVGWGCYDFWSAFVGGVVRGFVVFG